MSNKLTSNRALAMYVKIIIHIIHPFQLLPVFVSFAELAAVGYEVSAIYERSPGTGSYQKDNKFAQIVKNEEDQLPVKSGACKISQ